MLIKIFLETESSKALRHSEMLVRKVFGAPRSLQAPADTSSSPPPRAAPCTPTHPSTGVLARCIANFILFIHFHAFLRHRLRLRLRGVCYCEIFTEISTRTRLLLFAMHLRKIGFTVGVLQKLKL